jgi:RimJ/RimL family protein N-acetyltransferase
MVAVVRDQPLGLVDEIAVHGWKQGLMIGWMTRTNVPDELAAGPLVLRRWREEHLDVLMAAIETSLEQLEPWLPWVRQATREAEQQFLRRAEQSFEEGIEFGFGVFEQGEAALVGGCGMHGRHGPDLMEIGYWTESRHTGRGYATMAARALTHAAFRYFAHVHQVQIHCDVANLASARIAQKLGYRRGPDVDRAIVAPGQTGRGMVWTLARSEYARSAGASLLERGPR